MHRCVHILHTENLYNNISNLRSMQRKQNMLTLIGCGQISLRYHHAPAHHLAGYG